MEATELSKQRLIYFGSPEPSCPPYQATRLQSWALRSSSCLPLGQSEWQGLGSARGLVAAAHFEGNMATWHGHPERALVWLAPGCGQISLLESWSCHLRNWRNGQTLPLLRGRAPWAFAKAAASGELDRARPFVPSLSCSDHAAS